MSRTDDFVARQVANVRAVPGSTKPCGLGSMLGLEGGQPTIALLTRFSTSETLYSFFPSGAAPLTAIFPADEAIARVRSSSRSMRSTDSKRRGTHDTAPETRALAAQLRD